MPTPIILQDPGRWGAFGAGLNRGISNWADLFAQQKVQERMMPDEYKYEGEGENRLFIVKRKGKTLSISPAPISQEEKWQPVKLPDGTMAQISSTGKITSMPESAFKVGQTRDYISGEETITEEYTSEGWTEKARGPRYKPTTEVTTNVNMPSNIVESEATKKYATGVGERVNSRIDAGFEASNQNAQLDMVADALDKGAKTGFGEETLLNIKSAAQTLGFDVGDLSGQELIRKVSNEMALRLRNPESGLGLTGNTSNRDLMFLQNSVIGLQRTEQGNKLIIKSMKKMNQLKIDLAKYQQKIIKENSGNVPTDMDARAMEFVDNYKFFNDKERTAIENATSNAPQNAPQEAINYLKSHPETKDLFMEQFGYLPEGF